MDSFSFTRTKNGVQRLKVMPYYKNITMQEVLEDFEDWCGTQQDADDLYLLPADSNGKVMDWSKLSLPKDMFRSYPVRFAHGREKGK